MLPIAEAEQSTAQTSAVARVSAREQAMFNTQATSAVHKWASCSIIRHTPAFEAQSGNAHSQFAMVYVDTINMLCSDVRHRHSWECGITPVIIVQAGKVTASSTHAAES